MTDMALDVELQETDYKTCINCEHAKRHETLDVYWCNAGVSMFIAFGDRVVGSDFGCILFKPKI